MHIKKTEHTNIDWQTQKAGYAVTLLSIFFYGAGFSFDTISYYSHQQWFLLLINSPVLAIMIASAIYLLVRKKNWQTLLIIIYSLVIVNLILSIAYRTRQGLEISNHALINMMLGMVIVTTSAYSLRAIWTYVFSIFLSLCYLVVAIYTEEEYLNRNIILIPMLLIGTAFVTHTYIRLFKKSKKIAIESVDERNRLKDLMEQEKCKVNNAIEQLEKKVANSDIDFSKEILQVLKTTNYNLPDVVVEYTEKLSSNEKLFFNRLLKIYPNLTSNELKLCSMLVNNLSSKEIAKETLCTTNSVKVFRSRLRKKLGLSFQINLVSFLKKIELDTD